MLEASAARVSLSSSSLHARPETTRAARSCERSDDRAPERGDAHTEANMSHNIKKNNNCQQIFFLLIDCAKTAPCVVDRGSDLMGGRRQGLLFKSNPSFLKAGMPTF